MSADFARPRVLVSRCLGFAACRYNGLVIASPEVDALRPYVDFVDVCPEVEIGLGVPRDPIRLVRGDDVRLVQPATGRDLTTDMTAFAEARLAAIGPLDGAVLKSRSPSCGIKDTKLYPSIDASVPAGKTGGVFAREVCRRFPHLPLEDEGRLTNFRIRERFLTAIFTLASFRGLRERLCDDGVCGRAETARELTRFHAANKLLLMSQNQTEMRRLGAVAANREALPATEVLDAYADGLARAFARMPRAENVTNVLEHAMGYFKNELSSAEKHVFVQLLAEYRAGRLPVSAPVAVVREWIARFGEPYLEQQTFFAAYPEGLVSIRDSGLGR